MSDTKQTRGRLIMSPAAWAALDKIPGKDWCSKIEKLITMRPRTAPPSKPATVLTSAAKSKARAKKTARKSKPGS